MGIFTLNLIGLLVTGVWISLWFHQNSEWFPAIGGLLGLGSFFAWIAFVTNLLSSERKTAYQKLFDEKLLSNLGTLGVLAALNVAVLLWLPGTHGGLRIVNTDGQQQLAVSLAGKATGSADVLVTVPPLAERKIFLPTPFLDRATYRLRVSEGPDRDVSVDAFSRRTIHLPGFSWEGHRLALIHPTAKEYADYFATTGNTTKLKVVACTASCDKTCADPVSLYQDDRYTGSAVLIGTNADTTLPGPVVRRWRAVGIPAAAAEIWSHPSPAPASIKPTATCIIAIAYADKPEEPTCETRFEIPKTEWHLLEISIQQTADCPSQSGPPRSYRF